MKMTRDIAWASAQDAANRHMQMHHRSKWNTSDYNVAVHTFNKLWPVEADT